MKIVYRRAGIAFCFYEEQTSGSIKKPWRECMTIQKYYPTFVKAINGEYKRYKKLIKVK